ncbi:MAG: LPS export ABC transporter permease LptF [Rickettsiales bacterium]
MYHYNKYIIRHLVHSFSLIVFSLTSIVWLTQALRFVEFIVNQGVSISLFLHLTMLLIPSLLIIILPPAMFCAVLFTYNKLTSDSELVVMQAMGLSRWKLAKPAIIVAFMVTIFAYSISFYFQPVSYKNFRDMQSLLKNNYVSLLVQEGVFSNPVNGLTVFIRNRDADNKLHGILVHDSRQPDKSITMMAESGELVETPKGPRFLLENGNRQEIKDGRLSFLNFDEYTLDISLYTKSITSRKADERELFVGELLGFNGDEANLTKSEIIKRHAEGHQRILWPAYIMSLTLVAIATLLSGQFNRRGQWRRITASVIMATLMLFAAIGIRGAMAVHEFMVPVAYIVLLIPVVATYWILCDHVPSSNVRRRVT